MVNSAVIVHMGGTVHNVITTLMIAPLHPAMATVLALILELATCKLRVRAMSDGKEPIVRIILMIAPLHPAMAMVLAPIPALATTKLRVRALLDGKVPIVKSTSMSVLPPLPTSNTNWWHRQNVKQQMVKIGNNFTKTVVSTKPHAKIGVMKQIE